jgi:hypothetical protein
VKTELAGLLALCAAAYNRRDWLKVDEYEQARRCRQLASLNVLSVQALAAIFDVGTTRVEHMLNPNKVDVRGTLNPRHISILAYALSNGTLSAETTKMLVSEGTSIGMIARLTLISRSTLNRRLND